MSFRCHHQGSGNQAHPRQGKRVMVFLRRAMMIREPANALGHEFGGERCVGGFQVEPGDADVFPVMKKLGGKRQFFESA